MHTITTNFIWLLAQDSNYVYINLEYSKLEPLGAFFLITFIGIMAIQVCCQNNKGSYIQQRNAKLHNYVLI